MKYSLILPIYNAEKTIEKCLESLCTQLQGRQDIEVLLINDGSTDTSLSICQAFEQKFPQIRLFSKDNGGVSSARNVGLDQAQGDIILFVDADDAVCDNYFSSLDRAFDRSPDLLMFGAETCHVRLNLTSSSKSVWIDRKDDSAAYLAKALEHQELNLITTKGFRRELIERIHLRFHEGLDIGEDKVFALQYALSVTSVYRIPEKLYLLSMEGDNSLSRKKRDDLYRSALLEHRLMLDALNASTLSGKTMYLFRRAIMYSYYRSAYTVVRKLRDLDITAGERRQRIDAALFAYSSAQVFQPVGFRCRCISLPVKLHCAAGMDCLVSLFRKEKF